MCIYTISSDLVTYYIIIADLIYNHIRLQNNINISLLNKLKKTTKIENPITKVEEKL